MLPRTALSRVRTAVVVCALLLAACTNPPTSQQPSAATAPPVPPPTTRAALAATPVPPDAANTPPSLAPTQPANLPAAAVVRVIDGDTLDVRLDSQVVRLRLIGINTPEVVDPRRPVECFGREASTKAHELLDGQTVMVEADPSQGDADRFGRLLRYVWLDDGRLFNREMIAQGYAFEYTYNLPYIYQAAFKQAERDAREAERGLWSSQACGGEQRPAEAGAPTRAPVPRTTPSVLPLTAQPTTAPSGNCDAAYPDVCIPPAPPDLDCGDIPQRRFRVLPPDPHRLDGDKDGVGCES